MNARQRRRIDRTAGKDQGFKAWLQARPKILNRISEVGARRRYAEQMIREEELR